MKKVPNSLRLFSSSRVSLLCVAVLLVCRQSALADPVTDWNAFALETLVAGKMDLLKQERVMAIVQTAVYEAANAAQPMYVRSAIAVPDAPGASVDAAITEAAYRSLLDLFPPAKLAFEQERSRRLARIPDSPAKTMGIATGEAAAAAVLKWRSEDHADFSTIYIPGTGDGAYLPTSSNPMAGPLAFHMQPFGFASYADFRPPPPAPLDSAQMRRDLEEVSILGAKNSTLRTPEQTEIGLFHALPGIYSWSSIARQTVEHLALGRTESARFMALVETTVMDSHMAVWDAKYFYNLWRPVTALRAGGGPLHWKPIPDWTPLINTPMIPEYPCAHCGLGAGVQTVLEGLAGSGPIELTVTSGTVTRHYHSFRQFAEEESASRIYAGVHLRWSNYAGQFVGEQVGATELAKAARPLTVKP